MIKEDGKGEAVLCTGSKTYALKHAGTSNLLYVVDPTRVVEHVVEPNATDDDAPHRDYVVVGTMDHHLEPVEIDPDLKLLEKDLLDTTYEGEEVQDEGCQTTGRTLEELENIMPFSRAQILKALQNMDAVPIHGRFRKLEHKYITYVLDMMFSSLVALGVDFRNIPKETIVPALVADGILAQVVEHCLEKVCREKNQGIWEVDEALVCAHYGEQVLQENNTLPLDDFMERWKSIVPQDIVPEKEMIRGIGLINEKRTGSEIKYYPERRLSRDPDQRFMELFRERECWHLEDLMPYIDRLDLPGIKTDALIVKYTRRVFGVDPTEKAYYKLKTTAIPSYHL